jgi:hypothetical protein
VLTAAVLVSLACWTAPAPAANKIDDPLATALGKDIVEAAHPTAKNISLLEYQENINQLRD